MAKYCYIYVCLYRCRSAFKLLEIDEKYNILMPGSTVIDCGAAPGSWTQVAINKVNSDGHLVSQPKGSVIAIDRIQIYPLEVSFPNLTKIGFAVVSKS